MIRPAESGVRHGQAGLFIADTLAEMILLIDALRFRPPA